MNHRKTKLVDVEQIRFEEIGDDLLSIHFGEEKFVMDMDTLIDISFRCAGFLAHLESKEENSSADSALECGCYSTKFSIH